MENITELDNIAYDLYMKEFNEIIKKSDFLNIMEPVGFNDFVSYKYEKYYQQAKLKLRIIKIKDIKDKI